MLGPTLLGLGVWAAAGSLTVEAVDSSVRLGRPASAWWLAAAAIGWFLPALRRRPGLALPALLPVIAWLPVPMPPVILLWTGMLAWVPVGLVLIVACVESGPRVPDVLSPRGHAAIAGGLTLVALAASAWSLAPRLPSGDEPHYLMISASLLRDGDLRIANNHARADVAPYLTADARPHFVRRGVDGEVYSIHAPGVPTIVLPAFAAAGYRGAQATIILLASLTGALIWWLGWLATGERSAAWFAWCATAGATTFLIQGVTIFPDGPGALCVVATLVLLFTLERRSVRPELPLGIASVLLALLPWLHSRFVVVAAGMGLLTIARHVYRHEAAWRRAVAFLAVPAVSAAAWLGYFLVIYGSANPSAPYGASADINPAFAPGGVAGLIFDQQFGLLAYSPVLGIAVMARRRLAGIPWSLFWGPLVVTGSYLTVAAVYWMWWAGVPAPPARLATVALPTLVVPLAAVYATSPAWRPALVGLLAASLAISAVVVGVDNGALAWNIRNGHALWLDWLDASVDLFRGWPSFFWALVPGNIASETTFFQHVLGWTGIGVLVALAWRTTRADDVDAVAPLVLPLGLMAAVQLGWFITGSTGIDAARPQLRFLASEASVLRIAPAMLSWHAPDELRSRVRVRVFDRRQRTSDVMPVLAGVPADTYSLEVATARPRAGRISLSIGHDRQVIDTLDVASSSRQTLRLDLPAGAERLSLTVSPELAEQLTMLALRPSLSGQRGLAPARTVLNSPAGRYYFVDDNAFVEPGGFWVLGGRTSDGLFVAAVDAPSLVVANGPVSNDLAVRVGEVEHDFPLAPGEHRRIALPSTSAEPVPVSIRSSGGFRPSDDGRSNDGRYLGVHVTVESEAGDPSPRG